MKKNVCLIAAGLLLLSFNLFAAGKKPDPKVTAAGKVLYEEWGCTACHSVGKYGAADDSLGPDLKGLHKRRTDEWIMKFVKDPRAMIDSQDKDAVEMFQKYNSKYMKTYSSLSEEEWKAILQFIKVESDKK